ncbi:FAD-binding oxidoreductase [Virgibacillus salexigens]|uniref:FAD-binding oxidoreductase n=1 Tax=Virgibacillus salexigens TaxID=61016 RepID=UPI003081787D
MVSSHQDTDLCTEPEVLRTNNELGHPLGNGGEEFVDCYSEADISKTLAYAYETNRTVNIISGGTKRGYGGQIEQADILLSLKHYKGIVEHSVGDLTMTVRPGTTIKEITDELSPFGQCLALDPPWPEQATIGGVIAANDSGPKRLLYGSARDFVIGTRIVYADGRIIRTGGKVVKNVAGYDMNKLFIGSMGTLGVISEITLKLRPIPKYEGVSILHFQNGQEMAIRKFAVHLLDSMLEPVCLEVLTPSVAKKMTGKNQYALVIAFEDRERAVREQEKWIQEHIPREAVLTIFHQHEASEWWGQFYHLGASRCNTTDDVKIQAALKIGSNNLDVLDNLQIACQLADDIGVYVEGHGGVGHGITKIFMEGFPEAFISFVELLRKKVEERHGYVLCTHLPFVLRQKISVWGDKPEHFFLLDGIKQVNDPKRILNRKRYVGGL